MLGVMGLQAPELLSLSEEGSNEPEGLNFEEAVPRLRYGRPTPLVRAGCSKVETFSAGKPQNPPPMVLLPSKTGRDLLHLLALHRI
jgi:hypothetical protein